MSSAATPRRRPRRWLAWWLAAHSAVGLEACSGSQPAPPQAQVSQAAQAAGAEGVASSAAAASEAASTRDNTDLSECVEPPDLTSGLASPWSTELGRRLDVQLLQSHRCTADLPEGGRHEVRLRLLYQADGAPYTQHVASAHEPACGAARCLAEALAELWAPSEPELSLTSYDLALSLRRGQAPERVDEPIEPLVDLEMTDGTCVDPDVAALNWSHVGEVLSTTFPELRKCHTQAMERDHEAAGRVLFEVTIGQGGQVARALVRDSTLHDCAAIRCMLPHFAALQFPPPVGRNVRVLFPVEFEVEQEGVRLQ